MLIFLSAKPHSSLLKIHQKVVIIDLKKKKGNKCKLLSWLSRCAYSTTLFAKSSEPTAILIHLSLFVWGPQKLQLCCNLISGPRNWVNAAIFEPRNYGYAGEILYPVRKNSLPPLQIIKVSAIFPTCWWDLRWVAREKVFWLKWTWAISLTFWALKLNEIYFKISSMSYGQFLWLYNRYIAKWNNSWNAR